VVGFINNDRASIEKVLLCQAELNKKIQSENIVRKHDDKYDTSLFADKGKPAEIQFVPLKKYPRALRVLSFIDINNGDIISKDTITNYVVNLQQFEKIEQKPQKEVILPVFRVQFCASVVELDVTFYQNIIDYFSDSLIIISKDDDGMIRYMLGNYDTYDEAEKALNKVFELKQDGYITAYHYNKRIKTDKAISIINKNKP